MTGDKLIRFVTALAVLAVAVIAAIVSYSHVYDLGRTHGQSGTAARLLPLSVDGLILAASLVLLQAARNAHQAPALARFALWLGIGGTVAANLTYGLPYGPVGAVVSAWPGVAFVLAAEILLGMLRVQPGTALEGVPERAPEAARVTVPGTVPDATRGTFVSAPGTARPLSASPRVPVGVHAAEHLFSAEIEAGTLPSIRVVKKKCQVGQDRAKEIRSHLAALMSDPAATVEVMS